MRLGDLNLIYIYALPEPPLLLRNLNIIAAHLSLAHSPIFRERPILEAIATLPLHGVIRVLVLVPELHGDFAVREGEQLFPQLIAVLSIPLLKAVNCKRMMLQTIDREPW